MVRADFFAGLRGDRVRLDRGMKFCEETLAKEPDHADALVWHGLGLVYLARQAVGNDLVLAVELLQRGLYEVE